MTRQEESILRALPVEDRYFLFPTVFADRQGGATVGMDCADCDEREVVIREMKLSTM